MPLILQQPAKSTDVDIKSELKSDVSKGAYRDTIWSFIRLRVIVVWEQLCYILGEFWQYVTETNECLYSFFHMNRTLFFHKVLLQSLRPYKKIFLVSRPSAHHFSRTHQEKIYFWFIEFEVFGTKINCFSVKADSFCPLLWL